MIAIKQFLGKSGWYCFLLPIFFVLHNYMQYYGLLTTYTSVKILIGIEVIFIVCFLVLRACIKNADRSAVIVSLLGFFDLFFGAIKNFFNTMPGLHFVSKYTVLLPLITIIIFLTIRRVVQKKDFARTNRFLNILLLLFLSSETILLFRYDTGIFMQKNQLVENNLINIDSLPADAVKPDVWFLVFDSYPGSSFLQEYVQYNNTGLDSVLAKKGFYVASRSRSNYNRTAFSISSTMNFEYLKNIPDQSKLEPSYYNQASLSIARAAVPDVFIHYGYQLYNLSVFDLAGHPSMFKENFMVLPEGKMLLYNTFTESFSRDVSWNFLVRLYGGVPMTQKEKKDRQRIFTSESLKKRNFNNILIDSLPKIALQNTKRPKFIYAHFYLPHPPFFYDSTGHPLTLDFSKVEESMEQKTAFISYLKYTNKVIVETASSILRDSQRPPLIIVQSDHGYRDFRQDVVPQTEYFRNYSAFYFADKDYSTLYDSVTNINTFPIIFNKYFKTNIHLQKDVSVFTGY